MSRYLVIGAFRSRDIVFLGDFEDKDVATSTAEDAISTGYASSYVLATEANFAEATLQSAGAEVDRGIEATGGETEHPGLNVAEEGAAPEVKADASAQPVSTGKSSTTKVDPAE